MATIYLTASIAALLVFSASFLMVQLFVTERQRQSVNKRHIEASTLPKEKNNVLNSNQIDSVLRLRSDMSGLVKFGAKMQQMLNDLRSTTGIDYSTKRTILEHKWDDNRLMRKLQESERDANSTGKGCVIKVMQFCGRYCPRDKVNQPTVRFLQCPLTTCRIELRFGVEFSYLMESDVVIFLPTRRIDWTRLMQLRPPGQLWVYHSKESPEHAPYFTPPPGSNPFNISLTYLTDSDIPHPYAYFKSNASDENLAPISPKTKLISWVASNCDRTSWNRLGLVHALQKYLPIDTYGRCGALECPRGSSCADILSNYKFYLAFENSRCSEYLTEKFWKVCLSSGVVPIVYGAPKEDYLRLAPPKSFIHMDDFASLREFSDFIQDLDTNETRYREFFAWRKQGTVAMESYLLHNRRYTRPNLCYILRIVIDKSLHPSKYLWQRKHPDFYKWWTGMCQIGDDVKMNALSSGT